MMWFDASNDKYTVWWLFKEESNIGGTRVAGVMHDSGTTTAWFVQSRKALHFDPGAGVEDVKTAVAVLASMEGLL